EQRLLGSDAEARGVDEDRSGLHARELVFAEQPSGRRCQRRVHADDVRARHEIAEYWNRLDAGRDELVWIDDGVVREHARRTERPETFGNRASHCTTAEQANQAP